MSTKDKTDAFIAFVIGAVILGIVIALTVMGTNMTRSNNQRDVDIVTECQKAEDPEVCQALS